MLQAEMGHFWVTTPVCPPDEVARGHGQGQNPVLRHAEKVPAMALRKTSGAACCSTWQNFGFQTVGFGLLWFPNWLWGAKTGQKWANSGRISPKKVP